MLTNDDIRSWQHLPPSLSGLKVSILGMARTGIAAAKFLKKQGCHVLVSDAAVNESVKISAADLQKLGVETEIGGHSQRLLSADFFVRSPGVPAENPILIEASRRGMAVVSEVEMASWYSKASIVAVTGSNGKTTTVEWLGDMFRRAGCKVSACGNVGRPFTQTIEKLNIGDIAVVEVSSFQLEDIFHFQPHIAVITNFSPDHLDRYDSYDAYIRAKCRIFENQDKMDALIYNRTDQRLTECVQKAASRLVSFGCDIPPARGAGLRGDRIVYRHDDEEKSVLSVAQVNLPGRHNLENALTVICAGREMGISLEIISQSLKEFPGVPHRLEKVVDVNGIIWVNDSKATNIASGLVALESFQRPIILLAGGRDKGSDFSAVAKRVGRSVKGVILFGEAREKIWKSWKEDVVILDTVSSLAEAVKKASSIAQSGDVVLLSPMCASFDEFRNYEERGKIYKQLVRI